MRALQDQAFERLGGSMRVKVDVRVLAITNKDTGVLRVITKQKV